MQEHISITENESNLKNREENEENENNDDDDEKWNSKSIAKNIGLIILGTCVILAVGYIGYQAYYHNNQIDELKSKLSQPVISNPDNICTTPKCTTYSAFLMNSMNMDVNPCHDFYEHVCGNLVETQIVNLGADDQDTMSRVDTIIDNIIRQILESNHEMSKSEKLMKMLKNRCFDKKQLKNDGSKFLLQKLRKFGKWPLIDKSWKDEDFDLTDVLIQLSKTTTSDFGFFVLDRQYTDAGELRLITKSPSFHVNYSKTNLVAQNKKFFMSLFDFQKEPSLTQFQDLEDVAEFQMELRKIKTPYTSKIKLMNVTQLQFHVPNVDWSTFINSLVPQNFRKNLRKHFYAQKCIFLEKQLPYLLNTTKPRTVLNFLMLNWLESQKYFIFHNINNEATRTDESETKHRQFCFDIITESLSASMGMSYVYRYITQENIEGVNRMVSSIQNIYKKTFDTINWMGEKSKENAIRKIEEIEKVIGYPIKYESSENLDKLYEDLDIVESDSFYEMIDKIQVWKTRMEFVELAKTGSFINDPLFHRVNAQYSDLTNTIKIFAPFLRLPFFDVDVPGYTSYGSLGGIIGHEIGHGFDTAAMEHEKSSKNYNVFDEMMSKDYNKSVECFKNAYGSYKHPKFMINIGGEESLNENLADNIGVKMAFFAFKEEEKRLKKHGLKLPGFQNFTNDQMFFYGFARVHCDIPLSREQFENMKNTIYSPNRFRVNGVAMNLKEFAEAFGCKKEDRMNPPDKCVVF